MADKVDVLAARFGGVEGKLDRLTTTVVELATAMDRRFDAVDEAFLEQRHYTEFVYERLDAKMDAGFSRVDEHLERLDGHLATVDGHLARVAGHLATVDGHLARVDGHLGRLERKLDRVIDLVTPPSSSSGPWSVGKLFPFPRLSGQPRGPR